MSSGDAIMQALRKRFRSLEEAMDALGLPRHLLEDARREAVDHRGFTRHTRYGNASRLRRARDEEEPRESPQEGWLRSIVEILQGLEDHELDQVLERIGLPAGGEDWRRTARDNPPEFPGEPRPGGGMVPLATGGDRRRWGADRIRSLPNDRRAAEDSKPRPQLVPFHKDYDGLTDPLGEAGWG